MAKFAKAQKIVKARMSKLQAKMKKGGSQKEFDKFDKLQSEADKAGDELQKMFVLFPRLADDANRYMKQTEEKVNPDSCHNIEQGLDSVAGKLENMMRLIKKEYSGKLKKYVKLQEAANKQFEKAMKSQGSSSSANTQGSSSSA